MERGHMTNSTTAWGKVLPKHALHFRFEGRNYRTDELLGHEMEQYQALLGSHHVHCVKSHGSERVKTSNTTDDGETQVYVILTNTTSQEHQGDEEQHKDKDEEERKERKTSKSLRE